jgi:SulP family sulfate permease
MLAIWEAKKKGFLQKQYWIRNLISGVIVGVVALPLGMAFAIASGAKPEQGLYTSIVAGVMVALFGGSRVQIAGPTGAFIVVLAAITAEYGFAGLQIATIMAGIILLCLGLAKMGSVIKFIPDPVIIGFTSGIGVTIWVGQWRDFFGLPAVTGEHFHLKVFHLLQVFPQLNLTTTALAVLSLVLVVFSVKIPKMSKVPGPLVALLAVTVIQYIFQFEGVSTIGSAFGGIPQGLPEFSIPKFSFVQIISLIGPAFTIAMLGAIESLLSAVVADGMSGSRHDSNQELVGQGLANIVTPFFGGFAATGAIARTATNIRNGGNSPISGIVHSITLVLILVVLAPLAVNIPLATLAAILFVVAWNMSEAKHFIKIVKRAPRADVIILLITFGLTVFADLVVAVNIGVILATLHFLRRMASSVEVKKSEKSIISEELSARGIDNLPDNVLVFTIEGPFFFAAVENFERALIGTNTYPETLIIGLKWMPFIDVTGLQTLEEVIEDLHKHDVRVMLASANARVAGKLFKAGIYDMVGIENHFTNLAAAIRAAS